MKRIMMALCAVLGMAGAAAAEETPPPDIHIGDAVPGHPGLTYEALVKLILPDLKRGEGDGWETGGAALTDTNGEETPAMPGTLSTLEILPMRAAGKDLLAVMLPDFAGQGWLAPIGVFDLSGAVPKLVSAVNAGADRLTMMGPVLVLSPGDTALTLTTANNSISEAHGARQVLMLVDGKLKQVFSETTWQSFGCGARMDQTDAIAAAPDPGQPYAALTYTVTQSVMEIDESCDGEPVVVEPGEVTVSDVYRWDAAAKRYVAASDNLGRLLKAP